MLVAITAYYAWQTHQQVQAANAAVQEMRVAREAESAPYIMVYFDAPAGADFLDVVIKNFGRSAARDVRITFQPPLQPWLPDVTHPGLPGYLLGPISFFPPQ